MITAGPIWIIDLEWSSIPSSVHNLQLGIYAKKEKMIMNYASDSPEIFIR